MPETDLTRLAINTLVDLLRERGVRSLTLHLSGNHSFSVTEVLW